jgi:chromosome partitioning protein
VIDLDPQSNSTQYLMGEKAISGHNAAVLQPNIETFFQETLSGSPGKGLFGSALGSLLKSNERGLDSVVHSTPFENLWVIPSSPTLGAIEHALESKHKIFKLRDGLNDLSNQYDRIFIDTPPAFNFFTLSALIAANRVVIPFDCDVFSHRALLTLLENVIEAKSDHNARLEVEGIIVNQFQSHAKLPQQVVQGLKDEGLPVFESMLPASILMKESHQKSQPLIHLSPEHKLTLAYVSLFDEIEGQA